MAKAFSVLSWNVEHFGKTSKSGSTPQKPVGPIIDLIAEQKADVVAIYEVEGKMVFDEVVAKMPDYAFHITEGPQIQEILVGVKKTLTSFFTQRTEFKSGVSILRPGALLTITKNNINYSLLFLHLKSLTDPRGFGLRDDMVERAIKFKKILDKAHKKKGLAGLSNFLFMGDLNTMGMNLTYSEKDVTPEEEIARLEKRLSPDSVSMRVLDKTSPVTWWPGSASNLAPGNLDHVIVSQHLEFKTLGGAEVSVRGWVNETTPKAKDTWAGKYSDHSLLYFEVQESL